LLRTEDGNITQGELAAAGAMNAYYIEKVLKIRAGITSLSLSLSPSSSEDKNPIPQTKSFWRYWEPASGTRRARARKRKKTEFSFDYVSAGTVTRIVRKLKNTEALGHDAIPVSVLKKGIISLADPIANIVNRSLVSSTVPNGFKYARIHPVFKGGIKLRTARASYRPVAILPAVSKVLEVVVKPAFN
jgi:hypothetical protein